MILVTARCTLLYAVNQTLICAVPLPQPMPLASARAASSMSKIHRSVGLAEMRRRCFRAFNGSEALLAEHPPKSDSFQHNQTLIHGDHSVFIPIFSEQTYQMTTIQLCQRHSIPLYFFPGKVSLTWAGVTFSFLVGFRNCQR